MTAEAATDIQKAAVIGAGVMGAAIAAHLANAGVPVVLLDIPKDEGSDRSAIARQAIARLLKADPEPFMHRRNADLVTPGNTEDDIGLIADCDWIVEAIVERKDAKQALYRKLDAARKPGSVVSSNTSTIPLAALIEGMPESFATDFLITHFFNPPRYMRLLEIVSGPATRPDALAAIRAFADRRLGKSVVTCKDTSGFIANRIGAYWLQAAVVHAMDTGVSIEVADATMGHSIGHPKTGVFGLLDMVGLDLMPHVLENLVESLPKGDPFHDIYREPDLVKRMIADGYTGRKGKGGFYRLRPNAAERVKQAIDLSTGEYHDEQKPKLASVNAARKKGLRALLEHSDQGGRYARWVILRTLAYAARLVPEIADDVAAVDEAMRTGYSWKKGPFELIDELGTGWFAEQLRSEGLTVPTLVETAAGRPFYRTSDGRRQVLTPDGSYRKIARPEGVLLLSDIKRQGKPLARNWSASLWNIGDGVLCLEFHSKMNALDPLSLLMARKAVKLCSAGRYKALVVHNEAENFSVGANIGLLMIAAKLRAWFAVGFIGRFGQNTYRKLKYAPFPVVGAPSGMALGGGCEILLHADAIQAHAESYIGLVETGVGIVPAWGGCKEMLQRWSAAPDRKGGPMPPVMNAFRTIATAQVARSAEQAKDLLFLRPGDGITMNRDRLLADAKAKALDLAEGYQAPASEPIALPGRSGAVALSISVDQFGRLGQATPHDVVVGKRLAEVLSGGATDMTERLDEDALLDLERSALLDLARHPATQARVRHTIETGKPLRN